MKILWKYVRAWKNWKMNVCLSISYRSRWKSFEVYKGSKLFVKWRPFCRQHAGQPGGEQAGWALHRHGHLQHRLHQAPEVLTYLSTRVPDPEDPDVFGPLWSGLGSVVRYLYCTDPDPSINKQKNVEKPWFPQFCAALRIRDILVRIRIRRSVPLANWSGSGSWYYFQR